MYQATTQPLFSGMTAQTAHADQLAADLRDRRCCDAFVPCESCRVARLTVSIIRRLERVPAAAEMVEA